MSGLIVGCIDRSAVPEVVESDIVTTELELDETITGLIFNMEGSVFISQGTTQKIEIVATPFVGRFMSTQVSRGVWIIELTRAAQGDDGVIVNLQTPGLEYIELRSRGDIRTVDVMETPRIRIVHDGLGDMDLTIDTDRVWADQTGSGLLSLAGVSRALSINLAATGDLEAFELPVTNAYVNVAQSGVGIVEIDVADSLRVDISGPGIVRYKGAPVITTNITGSGSLASVD
ncbi:MAG: DUF2807 domain-containing protein [Bacteroidota bacterium]